MSGAREGYKVIDGPLKGQWRVSDLDYFEAVRLPSYSVLHRIPDAPTAPRIYEKVRYTLMPCLCGCKVWSCGQDA